MATAPIAPTAMPALAPEERPEPPPPPPPPPVLVGDGLGRVGEGEFPPPLPPPPALLPPVSLLLPLPLDAVTVTVAGAMVAAVETSLLEPLPRE